MWNKGSLNEGISNFRDSSKLGLSELLDNTPISVLMENGDFDGLSKVLRDCKLLVEREAYKVVKIPDTTNYSSKKGYSENEVSVVDFSIKNKFGSDVSFSYKDTLCWSKEKRYTTTPDIRFKEFLLNSFTDLIRYSACLENLKTVNDLFSENLSKASLPHIMRVVPRLREDPKDKILKSITDDELVFYVDDSSVLMLGDSILFDENNPELVERAKSQIYDELVSKQTTAELLSIRGGLLVQYLINFSSRKKPLTILSDSVRRDWKSVNDGFNGVFKYRNDDYFTILNKGEDGYEFVLSPVDLSDNLSRVDKSLEEVLLDLGRDLSKLGGA